MAAHAADAIAAGHARAVLLVYGSTARADVRAGRRTGTLSFGTRGPLQFEVPYGHTLIAKYAMAARRHMIEYGTTIEQLAEVAVQARANAALNPEAMYRTPVTVDEVLAGPVIADPFTKLHCCVRSDGGAAVLLVAEEYVRDCRTSPVWVLGSGECVSHAAMSEWPDFTVSPAAVSGRLAFERAGVRPSEIDVAEIYDAFTYMTLVTLEDLGFCAKGEGGAFVEKGRLRVEGGELPVNTDGGGLSAQHPGMRGLFLLVEAVRQLRGECGQRQVRRGDGTLPRLAVASGTGGWFCSSGTVVLGAG
jgi:acetyl-CoA acetyltransferase